MTSKEAVKVIVRCRPLNSKEKAQNFHNVVEIDERNHSVSIKNNEKQFTFDNVYSEKSTNAQIYKSSFSSLVASTIEGFNGTIFAYGQTGTGKTHTMAGIPEDLGVIPRSFHQIFEAIENAKSENNDPNIIEQYLVRASYLEIYMEEVRDLLSKDIKERLELRETPERGVYVKDLKSFPVKNVKEIQHVMAVGSKNRSVGRTDMNEHSSRSHAIFIVNIECSKSDTSDPAGKPNIRVGKLNMVDLAGSERQSKTGSTGERFKEATKINLSLANLSNVISSLVKNKPHIPYRDSQLTRLLQDSLGGNSKTIMVANIGPADYNYDETCNTLRYANRAKQIKNQPKINEDPKDAKLREYQNEIMKLRQQLMQNAGKVPKSRKSKSRRKKVTRVNEDGEEYEVSATDSEYDSQDEEDDAGSEQDPEEIARMKHQLEQDKESLLKNQDLHQNEKDRLLAEAERKINKIKEKEAEQGSLLKKINNLESKLLIGGLPLNERTEEQEKEIERKRKLLAKHQKEEEDLRQKFYKEEEEVLLINRKFTSQQEEVDIKTKKLKKLFNKLQLMKGELDDIANVNRIERNELQETQMELTRDLKLCNLIIDSFVPPEVKARIENKAVYDEQEGKWNLPSSLGRDTDLSNLARRPVSAYGKNKRPQSAYAKMAAQVNGNPRYRYDNILQIEIDLPMRTTSDYVKGGLGMLPPELDVNHDLNNSQKNFDKILGVDKDDIIEVEATPDVFSNPSHRSRIPKSASKYSARSVMSKSNETLQRGASSLSHSSQAFPESRKWVRR